MEEAHKMALDDALPKIVNCLRFEHISDKLTASEIFTSFMLEAIQDETSNATKIRQLVYDLKKRRSDAFDKFLTVLEESDCGHAANIINEYLHKRKAPSVPEETVSCRTGATDSEWSISPVSRVTDVRRSDDRRKNRKLNTGNKRSHPFNTSGAMDSSSNLNSEPVTRKIRTLNNGNKRSRPSISSGAMDFSSNLNSEPVTPPSKVSRLTLYYNRRYKMNSPKRGFALIINNVNFEGASKPRYGSDVDTAALQKSFEELDFEVMIKKDQSANAMKNWLKQVANKDHSEMDCFACIILSHGKKGVVTGTDEQPIDITDIIDPFKGNNCKSLCSKPKLFFIQACRGPAFDEGAQQDCVNKSMDDVINIPIEADILVHYATVEGYTAYRYPGDKMGSPFIEALSKQLDEYGNTMELLQLLTRVNGDVASNFQTPFGRKEMPHIASQLTKELYFNPKA